MRRRNIGRPWKWGQTNSDIYNTIRVQAHCGLGSIAVRERDIAAAIAQYEQALELDPDFTIAHLNLGGLLATQGKLDEAILHFRRSVELQPDNAPIYYSLAIALARDGKTQEAIANLKKALAIDPNFAPAKQSLESVIESLARHRSAGRQTHPQHSPVAGNAKSLITPAGGHRLRSNRQIQRQRTVYRSIRPVGAASKRPRPNRGPPVPNSTKLEGSGVKVMMSLRAIGFWAPS